jgi:hypothetical protein
MFVMHASISSGHEGPGRSASTSIDEAVPLAFRAATGTGPR